MHCMYCIRVEFETCMSYLLRLLQYCMQKLKHNHHTVCNVSMSTCFQCEAIYKHNFFADKLTN